MIHVLTWVIPSKSDWFPASNGHIVGTVQGQSPSAGQHHGRPDLLLYSQTKESRRRHGKEIQVSFFFFFFFFFLPMEVNSYSNIFLNSYIKFLSILCHCRGHPLPPNQKYICERLLLENYFLLHRLRVCTVTLLPLTLLTFCVCRWTPKPTWFT